MSLINEYRATETAIAELQARLKNLSNDTGLQAEMQFEEKLRALMAEYQKSLRDINALLDPQSVSRASSRGGSEGRTVHKRSRRVKLYKNPNNGEVIETKGGNHKVLKEWKQKYGADEVESWSTYKE